MATKVSGTTYRGTGTASAIRYIDWFTYVESETNTEYKLTLTAGMQFSSPASTHYDAKTVNITGTGQTSKSGTISAFTDDGTVNKTAIGSFTWTWAKGHSSANKTITAYQTGHSDTKASKTFTVPAKPSYTVSYNANGGSGAPANQTKWYGESLPLSSAKPTREGYVFLNWNTKADGSGTTYNSSGTYTANAAVTLYAQWRPRNRITVYDENGNKHTGIVKFYDDNGTVKDCIICLYDAVGNKRNTQ